MSDRPQNKNLKPFPKGVSGNPSGKPKRLLTQDSVAKSLENHLQMPKEKLAAIVADPTATAFDSMIAAVCLEAISKGDYSRLSFLFDRTIGKVKDISEVHQHNYDDEFDKAPKENIIELLRKVSK